MGDLFGKGDDPVIVQQPDPNALIGAQKEQQFSQLTPQGNLILGDIAGGTDFTPRDSSAFQIQESPFQAELRGLQEPIATRLTDLARGLVGAPAPTQETASGTTTSGEPILNPAVLNPTGKTGITPDGSTVVSGSLEHFQKEPNADVFSNLTEDQRAALSSGQLSLSVTPTDPGIAPPATGEPPLGLGSLPSGPLSFDALAPFPGQVDLSSLPGLPGDFSADRARIERELFDRQIGLLQPQLDRQTGALETTLRNQGIPRGSSAFTTSQLNLRNQQGDLLSRLAQDAVAAGGSEQSRQFSLQTALRSSALGEALTNRQLTGAQRQQGIAELQALRSQPFAELSALLTGAPRFPVTQFGQPNPVDALGAFALSQNAQIAAAQQQQASRQANIGGATNLAGALGSAIITGGFASSRQFKYGGEPVDTGDILEALERMPVERWSYHGTVRQHIGPYAEDFRDALGLGDGVTINYIDAIGALIASVQELSAKVKALETK